MANRENPLRHKDVRSLEGRLKGYHRLRVGEYRAIFETDSAGRRIGVLEIIPRGRGYSFEGVAGGQNRVLKTGRTRSPFGLSRTMLTRPIWAPLSIFQA